MSNTARKNKHEGLVLILAILGSLFAVAAIAIFEAFVPATSLVLTQGEYEILAALFYFLALIIFFWGEQRSGGS